MTRRGELRKNKGRWELFDGEQWIRVSAATVSRRGGIEAALQAIDQKKAKLKIYVASSWKNLLQPGVVAALRAAGYDVYDFKNPAPGNHGFAWSSVAETPPPWSAIETRQVLKHPIAEQGFNFDFNAMQWADAVVMVQPCGISAGTELAWAAGAGKLAIAFLADGQTPELMLKMADYLCVSMEEVFDALKSGKKR